MRIRKRVLALLLLTVVATITSVSTAFAYDLVCMRKCNWNYSACANGCSTDTTCSDRCILDKSSCYDACNAPENQVP